MGMPRRRSDDAVDVAVLGVGVVLAVTTKTAFLEELGGDGGGEEIGGNVVAGAFTNGFGDEIERAGQGVAIDVVVSEAGNRYGPAEEVDLMVVARDRVGKVALGGVFHRPLRIGVAGTRDQRSAAPKAHRGLRR